MNLLTILQSVCHGVDFEKETSLVDGGLIDSHDLVAIISEISGQLDIELAVEDIKPENFNSLAAIQRLVDQRRE